MPESIPRDEPTLTTGDLYTDDSSHKIVADVSNDMIKIFPSAAPLLVLQNKAGRQRTSTYYKFEWLEEDIEPRRMTVKTAATAAATSIVVESGDEDKAADNYVFLNLRTRENVLLTEDPTTNTIANAVRSIGGGGAAMNVGDILEFQAPVHPEGDTLGTIKGIKEVKLHNFSEIVRTALGWTRRAAMTKYYGGKQPMNIRRRKLLEHRRSLELRGFFGRRHSRVVTSGTNKIQTFSGGCEFYIKSHVWDLNFQTLTERALVEWMETVMELGDSGNINGDGTKWLFAGKAILTEIEMFAKDRIRYEPLSKAIGFRAGSFHSTHGTLNIVKHPLFTGDHAGWAFLLDMRHVRPAVFNGGGTKLLANRHARSFDGEEHEYMTDMGWIIENQAAHGIIKNHKNRG